MYPHSDDVGKRRIATTYNLTKDWKQWYGGNLIIMEDWESYNNKKFIVPTFNKLFIMDVTKQNHPHYVSHIAPGVIKNRYAVTGWFL